MAEDTPFAQRLSLWLLFPLVFVLVGVVAVFYVGFDTARVSGESMVPTLLPGDLLLVTRTYDAPVRGDIVTLDPPSGWGLDPQTELVKRVIALPGDELEVHEGRAYVNGKNEQGPYTVYVANSDTSVDPMRVPDGMVYVLGDNRPISEDSRIFGPVALTDIHGKVTAIFAPVNRIRLVD